VIWFSVCCAFDFRYTMELVIVTHQLFVLASTRRAAPKSRRGFHKGEQRFDNRPPRTKRRQSIQASKHIILLERCI